ncbi:MULTISPECIES: hypothetical protein, partial [Streptomyces]|uniref:hypothetical protein n=1 Tax=Streptomyces TaxID=1883 RepID=UPI00131C3F88
MAAPAADRADAQEPVRSQALWAAVHDGDVKAASVQLGAEEAGIEEPLSAVLPHLAAWHDRCRAAAQTNALRYRVVWEPLPARAARRRLGGRWLVVGQDGDGLVPELTG